MLHRKVQRIGDARRRIATSPPQGRRESAVSGRLLRPLVPGKQPIEGITINRFSALIRVLHIIPKEIVFSRAAGRNMVVTPFRALIFFLVGCSAVGATAYMSDVIVPYFAGSSASVLASPEPASGADPKTASLPRGHPHYNCDSKRPTHNRRKFCRHRLMWFVSRVTVRSSSPAKPRRRRKLRLSLAHASSAARLRDLMEISPLSSMSL